VRLNGDQTGREKGPTDIYRVLRWDGRDRKTEGDDESTLSPRDDTIAEERKGSKRQRLAAETRWRKSRTRRIGNHTLEEGERRERDLELREGTLSKSRSSGHRGEKRAARRKVEIPPTRGKSTRRSPYREKERPPRREGLDSPHYKKLAVRKPTKKWPPRHDVKRRKEKEKGKWTERPVKDRD